MFKITEIYFHEDDYCQIELIPEENYFSCVKQSKMINEHYRDNFNEGFGFTNILVRDHHKISLKELKIDITEFENIISTELNKVESVYTGYSSQHQLCTEIFAFSYNKNVVVFYDIDPIKSIVQHIWLKLNIMEKSEVEKCLSIFDMLSPLKLILVDWEYGFISRLNNTSKLNKYLIDVFLD